MREWRNWQTRTFEGRVVHTVRVQVPFLAPSKKTKAIALVFFDLAISLRRTPQRDATRPLLACATLNYGLYVIKCASLGSSPVSAVIISTRRHASGACLRCTTLPLICCKVRKLGFKFPFLRSETYTCASFIIAIDGTYLKAKYKLYKKAEKKKTRQARRK